jgi:tetratricopeptide (TPR) repeat protein
LEYQRKLGNDLEQMRLYTALGNLAAESRQHGQAQSLYDQALKIASDRGDRVAAARLHGRMGRIAQQQRDPAATLDHFKRAVHFAESGDDPTLIGQSLLHLATALHSTNDTSTLPTYRRALAVAQQTGDVHRETLVRLNMGILLGDNGQRDEALGHLYRAAELASEDGSRSASLADRIEETIADLGGSTTSIANWGQYEDDLPSSRDVVARHNIYRYDDELYREATLPPQ